MKKIYITVDVECHDIQQENNYIWGKAKEKEYGLRCILEQGKKHNIPINFFFDMCEANRYGEEYSKRIISTIQSYGQPVYLHLHPNYISGDDERSFLWQYTAEEQYDILKKGFSQYFELLETDTCPAFRVGRYGASPEMYEALNKLNLSVKDLSYCYDSPKMCHLYYGDVHTINRPVMYQRQTILPNTRFVCFDYFGKRKSINTDLHEVGFKELKDVLNRNTPDDIVFTMHSWNFVNRYFFKKGISGSRWQIRKFNKIVEYCKKKGFAFADVGKEDFSARIKTEKIKEEEINNCKGLWSKVKSLFYNFFRFQDMAKINKKYFVVFSTFYALIGVSALMLLLGIIL